jgi:ABC-type transport system involved in multi-copper enzyme maturation permease subunit
VRANRRRVRAVCRKELSEYRRNGNIIYATAILPLIFLVQPLIQVFTLPATAAGALRHEHFLLYLLAIPVLVPAVLAAYSVVGERLQGTLEPVLSTPVRSEELLLGKALAAFVPSVVVAYGVFGAFVAVVEIFAPSAVASAIIRGPELLAQVLFTPLLATWSIWVGIAISARSSDPRTAGQLSLLASLPTVAVTSLVAFKVIPPTLGVALGFGAALLVLVRLGGRFASALFNRERLITGTK